MKKLRLLSFLLLSASLILPGCKNSKKGLKIEFDDIVPTAYVGVEYDFSEVLVVEDDVKYNLTVYYQDYNTMTEKELEVKDDYFFTPVELFDLTVIVEAKKGKATSKRTKIVPVAQKGDAIDELLVTGAYSGYADVGFTKTLVTDPQYCKDESSHSALEVRFQGAFPYTYGGVVLSVNNFRLLDEWEDKTWTNAVFTTWVYNATEANLMFEMRIKDQLTNLVDVDWGSPLNPTDRIAEPGKWTQIVFSLRHFGVDKPLYANEEGTRYDEINLKVKWAGTPTSGEELYSYQFFVDNTNIVPFSEERFPLLDTTCYAKAESLDYGWENMYLDDGQTSATAVYDREFVNSSDEQPSLSSMVLKFAGKTPNVYFGFGVLFNPEAEFEKSPARIPSFRHGLLEFDIHYKNVTNKAFDLITVQNGWFIITRLDMNPVISDQGWTHLQIDLGSYTKLDLMTSVVRFGFDFKGIDNTNKDTAEIHIDNIKFSQNGGTPERQQVPETLADGWENMIIDDGPAINACSFENDYEVVKTSSEHESTSSLKLTFDGVNALDGDYCLALSPEAAEINPLPNLHNGIIDFDIKFSDIITNHDVRLKGFQQNWSVSVVTEPIAPVSVGDNWMHVTYNFASDPNFNVITSCIRLVFIFDGINESNKSTAQINIDNVRFIRSETLEDGWENMAIDAGFTGSIGTTDLSSYKNTQSHESTSSLKLTFDGATPITPNNYYCVTLSPEGAELNPLPNIHAGTIDFDIKFSENITNHNVKLEAIHSDWSYAITSEIEPSSSEDNWMHVTYNFAENPDFDSVTNCIRLMIIFDGIDDLNKSTAQINLDNILFTLNA